MLEDRQNAPHWTWLVYLEMFVAGIAAGAYVAAAILELSGRGRSSAARTAHLLAFPLMVLASPLLIADLSRPDRFWHMVIMSERGLPILKPWSPISLGTWLVMLFTGVCFVSFVDALIARRWFRLGGWHYDRTLHGGPLGVAWSMFGVGLAFGVGIYSGVLLTTSQFPGWANSVMIPAVYVATAMVTGVAAIILIEAIRGHLDPDVLNLDRTNLWLIGWWLVMVVLFLLSLTGSGGPVFLTGVALAAIFGSILLTGIVPLVLHAIRPVQSASSLAISAALVLIGGFLMRYAIVMAPQLH